MAEHILAQLINDQLAAFNVLLRSFQLSLQSINLIPLIVLERLKLIFLLDEGVPSLSDFIELAARLRDVLIAFGLRLDKLFFPGLDLLCKRLF